MKIMHALLVFAFLTIFVSVQHTVAQDNMTENNCPIDYEYVQIKDNTSLSSYMIDLKYGPPMIELGCEIEWNINFLNPRNESEFLENVQYDIIIDASVSSSDDPYILQSLAAEGGDQFLYSASGQVEKFMSVKHSINPTKYVIVVYGISPIDEKPSGFFETLMIKVPFASSMSVTPIPEWIKDSSSFWIQGYTSDDEFVSAIQYLVNEGIIVLPPTEKDHDSKDIPSWIKQTVGFWVDGYTTDAEFINAIQYLVKHGVITLS